MREDANQPTPLWTVVPGLIVFGGLGNFVKAGAAHDLNDYLVYSVLSYDADAGVQIVLLGVNLADFVVI